MRARCPKVAVVGAYIIAQYSAYVTTTLHYFLYRYERVKWNISGLQPVPVPGVENIDLSDMVTMVSIACNYG